jgi:hypothetical protein
MDPQSILVGKTYRSRTRELCRVTGLEKGIVAYEIVTGPAGPGVIGHSSRREMPLVSFADEMEGEEDSGFPKTLVNP